MAGCCHSSPNVDPTIAGGRHHTDTLSALIAEVHFCVISDYHLAVSTLRPRQNGRYFPDDIIECIFLKENVLIPIKISLKLVPKSPINNISALVQIMAWRQPGGKPLSEPMLVRLPTHICVTRSQWVNYIQFHNGAWHGLQCVNTWFKNYQGIDISKTLINIPLNFELILDFNIQFHKCQQIDVWLYE